MELQVAEIASSAAWRGVESALLLTEQNEFSICAGNSQCRTEGRFILNQGCPKRFFAKGHSSRAESVEIKISGILVIKLKIIV
jgi:hypothetical protein